MKSETSDNRGLWRCLPWNSLQLFVLFDYLRCVGSAGLLLFYNAGNQSPGILEAMPYNWALHPESEKDCTHMNAFVQYSSRQIPRNF